MASPVPPPVFGSVGSIMTFGDMVRRILNGINEPVTPKNQNATADYLNDGIESIWMSMLLATLSRFSKGPVTQVFDAGQQTYNIVTVPDPTTPLTLQQLTQGNLGARTYYMSYCLVTDSGSTTKLSPLSSIAMLANNLVKVVSPAFSALWANDVIGYYVFGGLAADGSDQCQQSPMVKVGTPWVEPPTGLQRAPNAPYPPTSNTTADNIFNIVRIDVQNVDTTWTQWMQTNLNSSWFTEFQKKVSTSTSFLPYVYDFIEDRQLEVRPALGATLTGNMFYTTRPRRLRFDASRLPYPQFALTGFLNAYVKGRLLLDMYEYDASDRWTDQSEKERQRVVYQVSATNFNQNNTIKPFMR
jgi:hypothetical protein